MVKSMTFDDVKNLPEYPKIYLQIMEDNRKKIEALSEFNTNATASFFSSYESTRYRKDLNGACHASLASFPRNSIGIVSYVSNYLKSCEKSDFYYDYLVNRSRFSHAFIKFDGKAFYCRTDIPSNYLAGALVATRYTWEYPYVVNSFYVLCKNGMNEHLAFCIAQNFNTLFPDNNYTMTTHGHNCIRPNCLNSLKNYIEGNFKFVNETYFNSIRYTGIDNLWGAQEESLIPKLTQLLNSSKEKGVTSAPQISFNPWQKTLDLFLESKKIKDTTKNDLIIKEEDLKGFVKVCNEEFKVNA